MLFNKENILVTGVERSGSTLVMRVLELCGAELGTTNRMRENLALRSLNHSFIKVNSQPHTMPDFQNITIPSTWQNLVEDILRADNISKDGVFAYKDSGLAQVWPLWKCTFPDYKWIIVRRKTGDILNSCIETAYMSRFKNKWNQRLVGASSEREAWLWWVHQYEERFIEMIQADLNYRIVWPERMRDGDFQQIREVVEWCGLEWNEEVVDVMRKLLK